MKKLVCLSIIFAVFVAGCIQWPPTGEIIANETLEPECKPNWNCTFWSDCVRTGPETGIQNRICTDNNNCVENKEETRVCGLPGIASKEPSEMALKISDLPDGWSIKESGIRTKEEASQVERDLGFKKGYNITFSSQQENDTILLKHFVSVYPLVNSAINMTFSFEAAKETYVIGRLYENTDKRILSVSELADPFIGDLSVAYNITVSNTKGNKENIYTICFTKWDVAEVVIVEGIDTDYDFLKDLAEKAEERIA